MNLENLTEGSRLLAQLPTVTKGQLAAQLKSIKNNRIVARRAALSEVSVNSQIHISLQQTRNVIATSQTSKLQEVATDYRFSVDAHSLECGSATNKENLVREEPKRHRLAVRLSSMIIN